MKHALGTLIERPKKKLIHGIGNTCCIQFNEAVSKLVTNENDDSFLGQERGIPGKVHEMGYAIVKPQKSCGEYSKKK